MGVLECVARGRREPPNSLSSRFTSRLAPAVARAWVRLEGARHLAQQMPSQNRMRVGRVERLQHSLTILRDAFQRAPQIARDYVFVDAVGKLLGHRGSIRKALGRGQLVSRREPATLAPGRPAL